MCLQTAGLKHKNAPLCNTNFVRKKTNKKRTRCFSQMLVYKYGSHVIDGQNANTRYDCLPDTISSKPVTLSRNSPPPPPQTVTCGDSWVGNVLICLGTTVLDLLETIAIAFFCLVWTFTHCETLFTD